ncbi:MAG: hypothetical protein JWM34_4913 [Ilumatobacteraceae bacterium]|nr:hypothetical protein [Ilumatobacteraceae bacterium]
MSMTGDSSSVSVKSVLDCVSALIGQADRATGAGRIVTVLLSERERFSRLLGELFRTAEGVLIDATECGRGVRTAGDVRARTPELAECVEELLCKYNVADPAAGLVLVTEDGSAHIDGATSYDAANTAQRAVRELSSAVLSEDLVSADLTGLIWADDSLDDSTSAMVWAMLVKVQTLLVPRPGSLLVLFAGDAALRPSLHCAGPAGVQYVVSSTGLARRKSYEANIACVRELTRFDVDAAPLVVMFLGAGASVVDGLPTGNELRNVALARQVQVPRVDSHNYEQAAAAFFERLRIQEQLRPGEGEAGVSAFSERLTLERVLQTEQAEEHRRDSSTIEFFRGEHESIMSTIAPRQAAGELADDPLVRLLGAQRRLVLVTVNFDRIIETKAPGLVRPFVSEVEFGQFEEYVTRYRQSGGPIPLLKLHGDIGVPNSIVANVDDTEAGLSVARLAALQWLVTVVGAQRIAPWWYVGYSMRDLDLEHVWANQAFADGVAERWVSPFVDPSVRRFIDRHRLRRWASQGNANYTADERSVALTAADCFAGIADFVLPTW